MFIPVDIETTSVTHRAKAQEEIWYRHYIAATSTLRISACVLRLSAQFIKLDFLYTYTYTRKRARGLIASQRRLGASRFADTVTARRGRWYHLASEREGIGRRKRGEGTDVNRRIIGPTTLSWSVDNGRPDVVAGNVATKEVAARARVLTPASSLCRRALPFRAKEKRREPARRGVRGSNLCLHLKACSRFDRQAPLDQSSISEPFERYRSAVYGR